MDDSTGFEDLELFALDGELPTLGGSPGITQGAYGERGNLELVVPDEIDGIWVFWNNSDVGGRKVGARPGCWSGGLRFAHGSRYDGAAIVQSQHGPKWLEVIATGDGLAHRFTWRPESGFSETGEPWPAIGSPAAVESHAGNLYFATISPDGSIEVRIRGEIVQRVDATREVRAVGLIGEGRLIWTDDCSVRGAFGERDIGATPIAAVANRLAWVVKDQVILDHGPVLHLSNAPHDIALAESFVGRHQLELVARSDDGLWHARLDVATDSWISLSPVRSQIWAPTGTSPIHRG